ncbi:hypothetical protein [Oceanobacillus sp. CAU 1775]
MYRYTRVIYSEDTSELEAKMNTIIADEDENGARLVDIKFQSVLRGGALAPLSNTVILIFEETE